ncbi:ATP-dependent RNA helicase [Coemansia sp. RSA 1722]|nr:ATP-dependent RNA helicase [Coemansia sp. RSA 485]KAJ2602491.1 ATP-dependent RNA helicase [Coemansia sp. RSA 1721]KAJ2606014.1 ATP-dependent RNA helicase [Coemansia sp. RSA 1722]KAJ2639596.1 ATP-dependent RNA helicase [Coemansia sp. RSA 1286]
MSSTNASAGNNNNKRRRGATKPSAEQNWADITLNPPPMPSTKAPSFLAKPSEKTQEPAATAASKNKNKKKKKAKTATPSFSLATAQAHSEEPPSDTLSPVEWNWTDVTVPMHIAGADNELGGMVSLQELDGVDCQWEEDASGGKTLRFFSAKKKQKQGGEQTSGVGKKKRGKAATRNELDEVDDDELLEAVDWDSFVAVDEFSEEKAKNGELVSIGSRLRGVQQQAEESGSEGSEELEPEELGAESVIEELGEAEAGAEAEEQTKASENMDVDNDDRASNAEEIADPDVDVSAWQNYGIHDSLLRALKHLGFSSPTEIQSKTLYQSLNGRDIIGVAETGSGKTLAFGIPMLQHISNNKQVAWDGPTGLVLVPTRELAVQVKNHLTMLAKFVYARVAVVVGGMSVAKQERQLDQRPDIIIATPGRFWELVSTNDKYLGLLQAIRFLAVDEADRMLQPGNFRELTQIFKIINEPPLDSSKERRRRQTFVFSATLLKDMQLQQKRQLSEKVRKRMKNKPEPGTMEDLIERVGFHDQPPHLVDVTGVDGTARTLTEARIDCVADEKDYYLYYFLVRYPGRTLVFVNSIDMIRRMLPIMRSLNISVFGLHAQMEQRQRLKNVDRFRDTPNAVLVASDVAARGLDIPQVEYVIHYQIPRSGDLYVHRSGRTARANQQGLAIMMVSPEERKLYYKMCDKLGKDISPFPVDIDLVGRLKPRVKLATEINAIEHRINKTTHERNWFKKHAEEMDIELDSDFLPSSDDEKGSEIKHREKIDKSQIKAAKARLARLLEQKILGRGVSARYLSSGVISDLAERLSNKTAFNEVIPTLPKQSALETVRNKSC